MEAMSLNAVVVICGETGSGKLNQSPSILLNEAGLGSPGSGAFSVTSPVESVDGPIDPSPNGLLAEAIEEGFHLLYIVIIGSYGKHGRH